MRTELEKLGSREDWFGEWRSWRQPSGDFLPSAITFCSISRGISS